MRLLDHVGLDATVRQGLERELGGLRMLADVVAWGYVASVPTSIVDVVIQDEFTHDVIVSRGPSFLVFDTT